MSEPIGGPLRREAQHHARPLGPRGWQDTNLFYNCKSLIVIFGNRGFAFGVLTGWIHTARSRLGTAAQWQLGCLDAINSAV
jgi:hypothetical protein